MTVHGPPHRGAAFALLLYLGLAACRTADRDSRTDAAARAPDAAGTVAALGDEVDARASVPEAGPPDDLAHREAAARAELGDRAVFDVEDGVFLLVAPHPGPLFDAAVTLVRKALPAYFHERFSRHPHRPVTVFLFDAAAPYAAFCARRVGTACAGNLGIYNPRTREILANLGPGVTTLSHEIVHPIVQTDFPDAPAWIDEGIGALFEAPVFPSPGEVHGATNWRLARLKKALSSRAEEPTVRLDALFGMSRDGFAGDGEDLHYAMARYACQWLDEQGMLWRFYRAWRDGIIDDVHGEKAFREVSGMSPAEATGPWREWVRTLRP